MLHWRLLIGTSIALLFTGIFILDWQLQKMTVIPGIALFPFMALLAILSCREMLNLAQKNDVFPNKFVTYFGVMLVIVSGWGSFVIQRLTENPEVVRSHFIQQLDTLRPASWTLSAFAIVIILVFLVEIAQYVSPGKVNVRISYTVFIIAYIGLFCTFLTLIRLSYGILALVSFVAIVKMGDVGAYTVGKIFGRTKLAPRLSPAKTLEGALGALLFSCITAILCFSIIFPWCLGNPDFSAFEPGWIAYGSILGLVGVFGDLSESLMKRDAEIKDTGTLLPGMGGILDMVDSLLLTAPVAYAFWALEIVMHPGL